MKKIIYLLLLSLCIYSCKTSTNTVASKKEVEKSAQLTKDIVATSEKNLGKPYKEGGTTTAGFDCSGLIYVAFKKHNIILPRSSFEMSKVGKQIKENEIRIGDLVFFKTNGKTVINHVGLVTEVKNNEIKFIHSSTQKGVIISSTKEPYFKKTFIQANRMF